MAIREDIVASAVSFLQDPTVSGSPLENRIAFLQSKNLTQEEVDTALARASGDAPSQSNYEYPPQQHASRQPQPYVYQQSAWQQPAPPPPVPQRDWRDWFIMATVMGGVSYGLFFMAKRYVYPMIAPPTTPQLEQDKQSIDESFEKAFGLLDQLAKDTVALKSSEEARTERLDAALAEVELAISELKTSSRKREDESRRISDDIRGLKDLIPRAMDGQKENTDSRLKELNAELKSLKTLVGQRVNTPAPSSANQYSRPSGVGTANGSSAPHTATSSTINETTPENVTSPKPASVSSSAGLEPVASVQGRTSSPFNSGAPMGKAAIPAWQMAAANKNSSSSNGSATATGSGSQEAGSSS